MTIPSKSTALGAPAIGSLALFGASLLLMGCPERSSRGEVDRAESRTEASIDRIERQESWEEGRLPQQALAATPRRGGSLTVRAYYEPGSLNPLISSGGITEWIVLHNVVETLVRVDPYQTGAVMLPALAKSWEVDEEGKTSTFQLREGVLWHDGEPFGSRDIVATFAKLRDPLVFAGPLRSLYALLDTVESAGEHTVVFRWKEPYSLAMEALAGTPIQPAHILESLDSRTYNEVEGNPLNHSPVGTGPFRFEKRGDDGSIVLTRNDKWWGEGPWLDEVVFEIVPDHEAAYAMTRRGELDIWDAVSLEQWKQIDDEEESWPNHHRMRWPSSSVVLVGWNHARGELGQSEMRRALSHLIDRQAILDDVLSGLGEPARCFFHPTSEHCDPKAELLAYDPSSAERLLTEAGWTRGLGGALEKDGAGLRLDLLIHRGSKVGEEISSMMRASFASAGIDLRVHALEWSVMTRRLREGDFDAALLMWTLGEGDDPAARWHSRARRQGKNFFSFFSARADAAMDAARAQPDEAARKESYARLQRILQEEQPVTLLYHPPALRVVSEQVRGVRPSKEWWPLRDWWVTQ